MKHLLLLCLLLTAIPAVAQTAKAASGSALTRGVAKLDAKNGFRAYRFGAAIESIPGLRRVEAPDVEGGVFERPAEPRGVGPVRLTSLYFVSMSGRLSGFVLTCFGVANSSNLLAVLREQYGPGLTRLNGNVAWPGKRVQMDYTIDGDKCTVTIISTRPGSNDAAIRSGVKDL